MHPHYLADTFKISIESTKGKGFHAPGTLWNFGMVLIGGALAFLHPAGLAISAWGVLGGALNCHDNILRHVIAINDSLIDMDELRQSEANRLERAIDRSHGQA